MSEGQVLGVGEQAKTWAEGLGAKRSQVMLKQGNDMLWELRCAITGLPCAAQTADYKNECGRVLSEAAGPKQCRWRQRVRRGDSSLDEWQRHSPRKGKDRKGEKEEEDSTSWPRCLRRLGNKVSGSQVQEGLG